MKSRFPYVRFLTLALIAGFSACGDLKPDSGMSRTDAVSDALSITQRADGLFDVVCRDGRRETVSRDQITADRICVPVPPPPPGARTIALRDRRWSLGANASNEVLEVFGKGLWEGYLSFSVRASGDGADFLTIVDALGQTWNVMGNTAEPVNFSRLVLPVTVRRTSDSSYGTTMTLSTMSAEVTRVNPLAGGVFRGKTDIDAAVVDFGADLTGVKMTFVARADFYANFTAGTACSALVFIGSDRRETVDAAQPVRSLTLQGPIQVRTSPKCQSTRLPNGVHPDDFNLTISNIVLGDPL